MREAAAGGAALDPLAALALARLQTGCAYGFFAQVAAIAGGFPGETWTPFWSWGESLGTALHLERQAAALDAAARDAAARDAAATGEAGDPVGGAMAALAAQLRVEAGRTLGAAWLPWGARPILLAAGAPPRVPGDRTASRSA